MLVPAVLVLALFGAPADGATVAPQPRPFTFTTDTFGFANETVWNYVNGSVQAEAKSDATKKRDYTRRCFVVTRAAVQFWKFARFDPDASPLPRSDLVARIRQVTERSVWLPALDRDHRVVFPGYPTLRAISAADPGVFQENIGLGWPVYFRVGNMPMVSPVYREQQARLNDDLQQTLTSGQPAIVWLYNFPSLSINHVVVVYADRRDGGQILYTVYDPNYKDAPKTLTYDIGSRTFSYQPTFYFKGGTVNARAIYRGVFD